MPPLWTMLVFAGILPFSGGEDAAVLPVQASGDIRFDLDAARLGPPPSPEIEIYLGLPAASLTASPDSSGWTRLLVETRLEDADGDEIGGAKTDSIWVDLNRAAGRGSSVPERILLTLRLESPKGVRQLRVTVLDLSGRKRGLLDALQAKKMRGEAYGRFEEDRKRCGLSDIVFLWDIDRSEEGADIPVRRRLLPNPSRFFGLYHTSLLAFAEGREVDAIAYRVRNRKDERIVLQGADSALVARDGTASFVLAADLSTLAAGLYRLEIEATRGGDCEVGADFQILWQAESWKRDSKAALEEAYVLLNTVEYEKVREMSPGEREAYSDDLWRAHDPDPSTGNNELRDVFLARVQHADRFFGTALKRGMLSDRGRVFIRFGSPDEMTKELNPQDLDLLANVFPGETGAGNLDDISGSGRTNPRDDLTRHRSTHDARAYEIWSYQVRGEPLFPDLELGIRTTGLKFIFVDDLGYGDMRLIYTNQSGAY